MKTTRKKPKKKLVLTRAQLDRALRKLFDEDREVIPRVAMPLNLYMYCQSRWGWG